jgi:hypothetical protein
MDAYVSAVVAKVPGISPAIIQAILAAIAAMLSGCIPVPTPPAITSGGGMIGTIILMRALRENGVRPLSAQGQALIAAMQGTAATAQMSDVESFLSISQEVKP